MTPDDRFGTSLSSWLREDAAHRVPDHLAETLVQTAATRQRPWWSSLERLLPMSSTTMGGRVAARNPLLFAALLALLLAAFVGLALLAGRPAPAIPAGPASNGRIVAVDGTSLVTFAPDGTDRRTLIELPASASIETIAMSPDGTRVAFARDLGIQVVRLEDGSVTTIPVEGATAIADEYIGWSPDGTQLVFAALVRGAEEIVIAAADGSSVRTLHDSLATLGTTVWQPTYSPDGTWIAFAGQRAGATGLFVIQPDGTRLRRLDLGTVSLEAGDGGGPVWSPNRNVHRLAYETFSGNALHLRMFDLDTGLDYEVGEGFWPTWSPDGSRLAGCCASIWTIDDVLGGGIPPVTVFAQPDGNCGDNLEWTGQAICSPVIWSPDGQSLLAIDVAGEDLLLGRADGTGEPTRISTGTGVHASGFKVPLGWQPIWP
jgi:hypothetical protein